MTFSLFDEITGFHHAITTRAGGVSDEAFDSLNLGFHVGDDAAKVRENRAILADELGFPLRRLVCAQQIHENAIHTVIDEDAGRGSLDWKSAIPATDALITNRRNIPLLILVADCAPLVFVDEANRAFTVVHAGWRGALAGIAGLTIERMKLEFGSKPSSILVGIGPCLSVENLEIGEEVAAQIGFVDESSIVRKSSWAKPHLDLRGLIQRDLARAGVLTQHVETCELCPKERGDLFFSHRGQNGAAGRFGIVAWWK